MKQVLTILFLCCATTYFLGAQTLPTEVHISSDGRLIRGGNPTEGLYNTADVHKLEITLEETNWFQLMDGSNGGGPGGGGPGGGTPGISLIGTLTFNDDIVLDSVLVSIKGQTSDFQNDSEKKSFKIEIDEFIDQDLLGYDNLNLNCGFQDRSSMREVLYYDVSRSFAPALKGAFVDLYINGESWGPYSNIQQIEGTYIKEWFINNDGTRWRADRPAGVGGPGGGGPGGGNMFGTGESTLNYNGPDSTDYNESYTLKKYEKDNPWEDLIEVCDDLNNLPIDALYEELKYTLDIDRTLWYLAQEMFFSDDDSYIHKGGMDYYVYWDDATDRIIPLEVDGNSVLRNNYVTWSPFYNEDDTDFPLLNRLLQNTEVRQRYLAHVRTILASYFTEDYMHNRVDEFEAILDQRVEQDPKKLYSYTQFLNGVQSLKDIISTRINYLSNHPEINQTGVEIIDVNMETSSGQNTAPLHEESVHVSAEIAGAEQAVWLYYGVGIDGVFERVEMYDDGLNGDQEAGDNIYGGLIPGHTVGTYVRYYVEAIKNDAYSTASYFPEGAEHDVFIYQVQLGTITSGDVVINEFMARNESTIADQAGEFDDWIELYNNGSSTIDLSGYYLSDGGMELTEWEFPSGTTIAPDGYLIIWADNDEDQASTNELHANFKLSADGEQIYLLNSAEEIVDTVFYSAQVEDLSYARIPNGTGAFEITDPTFNGYNGATSTINLSENHMIKIYPNPVQESFRIQSSRQLSEDWNLVLMNTNGQVVWSQKGISSQSIDVSDYAAGVYALCLKHITTGEIYSDQLIIIR